MYKKIASIAATFIITMVISTTSVFSKVDSILMKNNNGKLYQYSYGELVQSYMDYYIGNSSPLYNEYLVNQKFIVSLHDDLGSKYVSYSSIVDSYYDNITNNKGFNVNNFVENASDTCIYNPIDNIQLRIVKGGQVVDGEVITDPGTAETSGFDVEDIN